VAEVFALPMGRYLPATHSVQAALAAPWEYFPLSHCKQDVCGPFEYVPGPHGVHAESPVELAMEPAPHAAHVAVPVVDESQYFPVSHAVQSDALVLRWPTPHAVHSESPAVRATSGDAQSVQAVTPEVLLLLFPTGHASQEVPVQYFPA
jgi:hypothetical protein